MIRDFSKEAKETLYSQIDQVAPKGFMESVGDFFGDLGLEIQSWIGELCIDSYLNNVEAYHEKVLDKNDTTKKEIDKIFQEVVTVDSDYAGNFQDIVEAMAQYRQYINTMSEMILPQNFTNPLSAAHISIHGLAEQMKRAEVEMWIALYLSGKEVDIGDWKREQIEAYIEGQVNALGRDVTQLNAANDKAAQERVVVLYQMLDSDIAERFRELFDSSATLIDDFDRNNIMYIAYTADEPFRSLFLDSLGTYTIGRTDLSSSYFTRSGDKNDGTPANSINFEAGSAFYHCSKGAYNTFFHECGHAIDYNIDGKTFFSNTYNNGSNYDIIAGDVYTHIETEIKDYINNKVASGVANAASYQACSVENIIDCIKNGGDTSILSASELKVYNNVKNSIESGLNVASLSHQYENNAGILQGTLYMAGISDVYNGVTNNVIAGGRGHWNKETTGPHKGEYNYWYNPETGERTGNHEVELWAHYFSFEVTGDQEAITAMNQYFPTAMQQYDDMTNDMKESYKK